MLKKRNKTLNEANGIERTYKDFKFSREESCAERSCLPGMPATLNGESGV